LFQATYTTTNRAKLEALVAPTITLSAVNPAGSKVSTNVSVNEASFVAGIFSDQVVMSNSTMAQMAVDQVVAGLKNGTVAFVLPGVQLLIAPIGLVITGTWLVLGLIAYGIGTIDRINYAESYRRASSRATKGAMARI
jgi:hypothetical protein